MACHGSRLGPDVADVLAGLLSASKSLRIPTRDPDLGQTPTLQTLRAAQGRLFMSAANGLETAQMLGLYPREIAIMDTALGEVPRSGSNKVLDSLTGRLDRVIERLDSLDQQKENQNNFVQQEHLLGFYLGAMRVEVDFMKFHLNLDTSLLDLGAVARAAEVMSELTGDFVATVRAWSNRVSTALLIGASDVKNRVSRVVFGVRTVTKFITKRRNTYAKENLENPQTGTLRTKLVFDRQSYDLAQEVFAYLSNNNIIVETKRISKDDTFESMQNAVADVFIFIFSQNNIQLINYFSGGNSSKVNLFSKFFKQGDLIGRTDRDSTFASTSRLETVDVYDIMLYHENAEQDEERTVIFYSDMNLLCKSLLGTINYICRD